MLMVIESVSVVVVGGGGVWSCSCLSVGGV